LIPGNESGHLYEENKVIDLDFATAVGDNKQYKFTFKGTERIIRRAQGLFQILPIYAKPYVYSGASNDVVLTALRSPYSNALMAGAILDSARTNMITDPDKMAKLNEIANMPNWQRLAQESGNDPVELLLNGMMALSHNVGQGGAWDAGRANNVNTFKNMTYTKSGSGPNAKFIISGCPNYTNIIIGSICNGELDRNSQRAPNSDL
jgi:hypothetical protein